MAIHFSQIPATFVHVPKTGGTSFETWCFRNLRGRYETNVKHADWNTCQQTWSDPGRLIVFCRDPWNRACSMYFWGAYLAGERMRRRAKGQPVKESVSESMDRAILDLFARGFPAWVRALYDDSNEFQDHFGVDLRPRDCQIKWFSGHKPDILIHLERIEDEFPVLQDMLGCHESFPHVNRTQHRNHVEYYDDESRRLIAELYRDDIEMFGYEF